ncbi:MAG: hypothetical protein ACYCQI_11455 [Gammaproteobacteria bacterium]
MSGARIDSIELSAENVTKLPIYEFLGAFTCYFQRYGLLQPKSKIINYHIQLDKLVCALATNPAYKNLFEIKEELLSLLQIRDEKQIENTVGLATAKACAENLRNVICEHFKQNPPTFLSAEESKSVDQELLDLDYRRFYPYFLCSLASLEVISINQAYKSYLMELLGACLPHLRESDPRSPRMIAEITPDKMFENQQNFKNLISWLAKDEELKKFHLASGYIPVEQLKKQVDRMRQYTAYMYKKIIAIIDKGGAVNLAEQEYYFHLFCRMALNETQQIQNLKPSPRSPRPSPPVAVPSSKKLDPAISQLPPGALISGSMWTRLNELGSGIKKATGIMANLASQVGIPH